MNLFPKIIKNPLKGAFQKGSIEDPELTSFHRLDKSTGTHGMISPEKELQTTWAVPPQQKIKGPYRNEEERQRYRIWPKAHVRSGNPQLREIATIRNIPLKREDSVPHIKHPNPWVQHYRDKSPKCVALKTNGGFVQENRRTIGNRKPMFKRITYDSLPLGPSTKASSWKAAGWEGKEICLLIFNVCQRTWEFLPWGQRHS